MLSDINVNRRAASAAVRNVLHNLSSGIFITTGHLSYFKSSVVIRSTLVVSTLLLPIPGLLAWLRGLRCLFWIDGYGSYGNTYYFSNVLQVSEENVHRAYNCLFYKSSLASGGVESHCILIYCWNCERGEAGWVEGGFSLQPFKC